MRTLLPAVLALALAVLGGCGGCMRPPAPLPVPAPPDLSGLPSFESLDYANWKRFPLGTVVRRKSVTSAEGATAATTSVERFALKEVTDHEAVVERQNTTERSDGSYRVVNPAELRKYPRQFAIPPGMSADDFSRPARGAKRAEDEVLTVLGKNYSTAVYSWSDSTEAGPMTVRVWLSDDMPGRVVKQVMVVPSLKNTTVEEVIEVAIP